MKRPVTFALLALAGIAVGFGCGPDPDRFVLPETATVTGTLLEAETVPPDPRGVVSARITLEVGNNAPKRGFLGPFFSNSSGNYVIPNIPAGIYDLVAEKFVGTPPVLVKGRTRFIQLEGGEQRVLPDLVLRRPGTLRGVALLGGANTGGHGGITVSLEGTLRTTPTAASGAFQFDDVAPGLYTVLFQKTGFIEETLQNVEVLSATATDVAAALEPLDPQTVAAIAGRVLVEPRDPATGDHGGAVVTVEGTSRSLVTTQGGFFRFESLPLATYTLRFERQNTFTRRLQNVTLRAGQTVNDVGSIQLDTHRALLTSVRAFDLEHSPNGTQVAYIDAAGEIAVMDSRGQVFNQRLTSGARAAFDAQTGRGRGLSWSPDGTEILFVRFEGFPSAPFRIGVVPSEGGSHRTLLTSGNEFYTPAWAPDGRAFDYYLTPDLRRVQVSRDTLGRTTAVTSTDRIISGSRPPGVVTVVSGLEEARTGRVVYSFATTDISNGIFSALVPPSGSATPVDVIPRRTDGVTLTAADSPTFSPDASRIAFSINSADTTVKGIYLMNLDGSQATRLTTQPGNNLDFSPDGNRVLFTDPAVGSSSLGRVLEVLVPR